MKHVPKETTDESLIQEFLNNGGKISDGKTKPPPSMQLGTKYRCEVLVFGGLNVG